MSRPGKPGRSRSASPEDDEDADYQLALRLSEEINGGQATSSGAGLSQQSDYDNDADFEYALKVQFGDSNRPYQANSEALPLNAASRWDEGASKPEALSWTYKKDQPKIAKYHSGTTGGKTFGTLPVFLAHIMSARCSTCEKAFFESKRDIDMMLQEWKGGKSALSSVLTCTNCEESRCISCTPEPSTEWSVVGVHGKELTWCCAGGRTLLLWVLLCSLDDHFSAVKLNEAACRKPKQQPKEDKRGPTQRGRGGVGFGGSSRPGMGYGSDFEDYSSWGAGHTLIGHRFDAGATNTSGKAKALTAQQSEDQFYELHLHFIEALLPMFERESSFDFEPPDSIAEMLVVSKLLNYCAELLRNDSLEDATMRRDLYHALISLLRTLGAHYATASATIYNERPLWEDKVNLPVVVFHGLPGLSTETASSLLGTLTNLNAQSELVLQGAKRNEKEFHTHGGQNLLLLCRQISDLRAYLVANSGTYGKAATTNSKTEIPALSDRPDEQILLVHAYGQAAKALRSAPSGRFKSLISQITTLKTGLPPGIFVRYAESRPDVQKVVIIGPEGTPYANGIFEFDIFCDASFPNKPPLVQFRTTGGGRINFNPNLYADGKVCLSLLGTWQGEPWVPGESTLLQVVISIQAMILCEEPWYNEPGREVSYASRNPTEGPSASYNAMIRGHTIETAMLDWLHTTPPLWKDVVDQHFTTNANKILHTAVEWSKTETSTRSYRHHQFVDEELDEHTVAAIKPEPESWVSRAAHVISLLPRLQKALKRYGASQIVPENPMDSDPSSLAAPSKKVRQFPQAFGAGHTLVPHPLPSLPPQPPYLPQLPQFPQLPQLPQMPQLPPVFMQPNPYKQYNPYAPHGYGPPNGFMGGFMGPGRTLGDGPSAQIGTEAQNTSSRSASLFLSEHTLGHGRYETRSSTRGRGGPSLAMNLGVPPGGNTHGFGGMPRGGSYVGPPSRGGYCQDQARGGLGGRGDSNGRGGRGGRGGSGGLNSF